MIYRGTLTCPTCGKHHCWIHETRQQLFSTPIYDSKQMSSALIVQMGIEDGSGDTILVGDCSCGASFTVPYVPG